MITSWLVIGGCIVATYFMWCYMRKTRWRGVLTVPTMLGVPLMLWLSLVYGLLALDQIDLDLLSQLVRLAWFGVTVVVAMVYYLLSRVSFK